MAIGKNSHFSCAANFLKGRKYIFCGSFKVLRTARGYVECRNCGQSKSLSRLRSEIAILQGFYQLQPAYRLASDLGLDIKVVSRVYQRLREALFHLCELEGGKLKGGSNSTRPISVVGAKAGVVGVPPARVWSSVSSREKAGSTPRWSSRCPPRS